ncbi:MAG: DUF1176 domain-containing protein [Devosia sp.]
MRILLSLLFFCLAATATLAQEHGEVRRYFKDWLVACRADGYCSATAYQNPNPGDGSVAHYIFRVGRHAQESYWELSFTPVVVMADEWQDFIVGVDGMPQTFSLRSEIGAYGAVNDFYLLGDGAQAMMDRLAPGSKLTVDFTDTTGASRQAEFSLAGLTASLVWIDEQQRRLGSERVASAPPRGLSPAGSEQARTPQIPVALLDRMAAEPDCEPFDQLANGRDFFTGTLDDTHTLHVLPCWSAAYNFGSKVFVDSLGSFEEVLFADYTEPLGWIGTGTLVNAYYDDEEKQLMSVNKARGVGDCGSSGLWRWHEYAFKLIEFRYKEDCDGEIGDWPIIYPAQP